MSYPMDLVMLLRVTMTDGSWPTASALAVIGTLVSIVALLHVSE